MFTVDFKCSFTILSTPPALLFFSDLAAVIISSSRIGWLILFAFISSLFRTSYSVSSSRSEFSLVLVMLVFISW